MIDGILISITAILAVLKFLGYISLSWFQVFIPVFILMGTIAFLIVLAFLFPEYFKALYF